MEHPGTLLEKQRAEMAQRCLEEAFKAGRLNHYRQVAAMLPRLIRQHGLGQTLAYLQARGKDQASNAYQMVFEHLCLWLAEALDVRDEEFFKTLTTRDSRFYLHATEEAWHFSLTLIKAS